MTASVIERHPRWVLAGLASGLLLFAAMSWRAATLESPTFDEPVHTLSGVVALERHDYRLNTEHPVLWKLWASLPDLLATPLALDTTFDPWHRVTADKGMIGSIVERAFFAGQGNDPNAFIGRARFMMLLVGVALGALIALWAWRLAGPVASLAATFLYVFDPNFLGHASLVTNDVALSFVFLAIFYATWRIGQSVSAGRIILLAVSCAAAVLVKYAALIAGPVVALLLVGRALQREPWQVLGREKTSGRSRIGVVALVLIVCAVVAYAGTWACYGFRFSATADGTRMDLQPSILVEEQNRFYAANTGVIASPADLEKVGPSTFSRGLLFLSEHHLLPEAYIDGMLYQHAKAIVRATYLLGEQSSTGAWYYFPVAMLVKTPTATLIGVLIALAILVATPSTGQRDRWSLWVLTLPPLIYFAAAVSSNLNLGLRHVFPVYPFLFIAAGIATARMLALRPRITAWSAAALAALLVVESVVTAPYYIPFFNFSAGGSRGGIELLSDSNLDWGQGLKLLAAWQREHGKRIILLSYFGSVRPSDYGVNARPMFSYGLAPGFGAAPVFPDVRDEADVMAFGATMLQGFALSAQQQEVLRKVRQTLTPIDVLGGCIYLYPTADVRRLLGYRS